MNEISQSAMHVQKQLQTLQALLLGSPKPQIYTQTQHLHDSQIVKTSNSPMFRCPKQICIYKIPCMKLQLEIYMLGYVHLKM